MANGGFLDKVLPFVSEAFSSSGGKNWNLAAGSQKARNDIARNTTKAPNWDISSDAARQRAAGNKNIADRRVANIENRIDSLKPQQEPNSVSGSYIPMSFSAGSGVYRNPFSISKVQDNLLKNATKSPFEDNAYNDVKDIGGSYDLNSGTRQQRKSALRQQQASNAREYFVNNAEQTRQEIADAREKQAAADWNRKSARLYEEYQRAAGARDSIYSALGLSTPARALSVEDLGIAVNPADQTSADKASDKIAEVTDSDNELTTSDAIAEGEYTPDVLDAYMNNGYFDENAYIADLMESSQDEYWQKTFPKLLEEYNVGNISEADLFNLINMMSWDEFHDFATNDAIFDLLYSNAYILDDEGNRIGVNLRDPYGWDQYRNYYGGGNLDLQHEAETGNWANASAIYGSGTNVAGQQIANITGYNPMTGEMTGSIHPDGWDYPVGTLDFEQTYGAFPDIYGFSGEGYDSKALSEDEKAMIAATLADVISRDSYGKYLEGNIGAYNRSGYGVDDDGLVNDFYMIESPDSINPYLTGLSYYSSRRS